MGTGVRSAPPARLLVALAVFAVRTVFAALVVATVLPPSASGASELASVDRIGFLAAALAQSAPDQLPEPVPPSETDQPVTPAEPETKTAKTSKKKSKPFAKISGTFGFEAIYDDNVFRFSPENLRDFRMGLKPDKFKLDTYDDFIVSPSLSLDFARPLLAKKNSVLRVKYTYWQYFSNPDKSNASWWFRLTQPAGNGNVELHYFYTPWAYIRELTDRPPYTSRVTSLAYVPFRGTRNAFRLGYAQRINKRFFGRIEGERVIRYYNRPHLENDNWEWNISGILLTNLHRRWRLTTEYTYSTAEARGYDSVGETLENSDDGDGSYDRDYYRAALRFRPRRAIGLFRQAEATYKYMAYYFTSEKPYYLDSTHRGRKDEIWSAEIEVTTDKVYGPLDLAIGYRYSTRSSTATASEIGVDAIEEDKNYEDNRFWIGTSYSF